MPRSEYVLAGIKRVESHEPQARSRLLITIDIMHKLRDVWLSAPEHPDHTMLWAAACERFFGFLQAGEFTVPSAQAYDPEVHLNLQDLGLDSHLQPSLVRLCIKQDPFRQGVEVFLGKTDSAVCPVTAIIQYVGVRPVTPGPLFIRQSGVSLTRSYLVSQLQAALRMRGIDDTHFNGHSFRIGGAATAAKQGLEDSLIQSLGRWQSDSFKTYIKLSRANFASVSRVLAQ